ncbi:DsbA family protein [Dongia sp.]|uniref:DsbA family protein n=1 Tax=Dongia sp. TaxID=1977262 RepID=UPI003752208F
MNRRKMIVLAAAAAAACLFAGGAVIYSRQVNDPANLPVANENSPLIRPHSPILGPTTARVTIVEFFDPSCESCRAFYPFVKRIMADNPEHVRVVLRYTPFHPSSEEAVKILEAARKQDKFLVVLEALLDRQQEWGADNAPNAPRAWGIAGDVGLDLDRAIRDGASEEVKFVLAQDVADVQAMQIKGTPTFFVNGKRLTSFGPDQLAELVKNEVMVLD